MGGEPAGGSSPRDGSPVSVSVSKSNEPFTEHGHNDEDSAIALPPRHTDLWVPMTGASMQAALWLVLTQGLPAVGYSVTELMGYYFIIFVAFYR